MLLFHYQQLYSGPLELPFYKIWQGCERDVARTAKIPLQKKMRQERGGGNKMKMTKNDAKWQKMTENDGLRSLFGANEWSGHAENAFLWEQ